MMNKPQIHTYLKTRETRDKQTYTHTHTHLIGPTQHFLEPPGFGIPDFRSLATLLSNLKSGCGRQEHPNAVITKGDKTSDPAVKNER